MLSYDRYQQITNLHIKESIKIYLRLNSSLLKIGLIVDELLVPFQNFSSLYIALNFVLTNNPKSFSLFVSQGSAQTHAVNRFLGVASIFLYFLSSNRLLNYSVSIV